MEALPGTPFPLIDDDFLVLVNSWWEAVDFVVPETRSNESWCVELDTSDPAVMAGAPRLSFGQTCTARPRSVVVLRGTSSP